MTTVAVNPVGTVVEVISDKSAVLVEVNVTITETNPSGGGNSTSTSTTRQAVWIVPAKILVRGTKRLKDYLCYEVGEKVIVLAGSSTVVGDLTQIPASWLIEGDYDNLRFFMCYVVGAFYENDDDLPARYEEVAMIKFPDGSEISYNFEDKELELDFKGDVTINGRGIYLNS